MCLEPRPFLCQIRLCVPDARPLDHVTLCACSGYVCRSKELLCSPESVFAALPPGLYVLTLCRGRQRRAYWIALSPGSAVRLCVCVCGRLFWQREWPLPGRNG